jgi:oxygen-dependent protoporphyrinogen oxidase
MERIDVAIIGGGIAGLSVADRLRSHAPELSVRVLEASDRPGGKIRTERIEFDDGRFIVEAGPDALLAQKPSAMELVADLGLSDQVIPIERVSRSTAILKHGRLVDLPEGVALVGPTRIRPFLGTELLSPAGKLRAGLDLLSRPNDTADDESLAAFVTRHFGREALDWIAEPLAAGIYNADPDRLSVLAAFPHLHQAERQHGSVIRGLRATRKPAGPSSAPAFVTFRDGMQTLIDALAARLDPVLNTNAPVTQITALADGGYAVLTQDRTFRATTVVLAVPAAQAATLLAEIAPNAARELSTLQAVHAGTISLAYRPPDIHRPLPGYGLIVPKREHRPINAITVASRKFAGRAPKGWTLLRVFFGGYRSPETMQLDDVELRRTISGELFTLLGIAAEPVISRIQRWPAGSPQYDVGHLDRVRAIETALPADILVTGSPYRGVGIPDVINQARQAADQLAASIRPTAPIVALAD